MVHLLPSDWNAPKKSAASKGATTQSTAKDKQGIRVIAFSNAKQVELFLNGHSLGTKDVPHDGIAEWRVPYEPGQLLAEAYTDNKTVATDVIQTNGAPVRLVLSPDRTSLATDALAGCGGRAGVDSGWQRQHRHRCGQPRHV